MASSFPISFQPHPAMRMDKSCRSSADNSASQACRSIAETIRRTGFAARTSARPEHVLLVLLVRQDAAQAQHLDLALVVIPLVHHAELPRSAVAANHVASQVFRTNSGGEDEQGIVEDVALERVLAIGFRRSCPSGTRA